MVYTGSLTKRLQAARLAGAVRRTAPEDEPSLEPAARDRDPGPEEEGLVSAPQHEKAECGPRSARALPSAGRLRLGNGFSRIVR